VTPHTPSAPAASQPTPVVPPRTRRGNGKAGKLGDSGGFEAEAQRVLGRLRSATAGVLNAVGGSVDRAADLRRCLDLDAALAWQVHTIASSDDPLRAGRIIPKAGAMERFLQSARARGAAAALVREAEEAYADYQRLIGEHAGDRETLDAMLSALRPEESSLKKLRRTAYKANAAVWGVTVRCLLNCVVFHQRPSGEHDCLSVRGRLGVRRLREGAVVGIYASGRTWGGSTCPPEGAPGVMLNACDLIEEACSSPVPAIERVAAPDGTVREFLRLEGLGRSSEVSVVWRNLALNFPGGSARPPHGCSVPFHEPTETAVMDLLVPRGWTDPATARAWVTATPYSPGGPGPAATEVGRGLPLECELEYVGTRLDRLYTRHAPAWAEIIGRELERLGWPADGFDIFRCQAAYPILHSSVHLCVDGPPPFPLPPFAPSPDTP